MCSWYIVDCSHGEKELPRIQIQSDCCSNTEIEEKPLPPTPRHSLRLSFPIDSASSGIPASAQAQQLTVGIPFPLILSPHATPTTPAITLSPPTPPLPGTPTGTPLTDPGSFGSDFRTTRGSMASSGFIDTGVTYHSARTSRTSSGTDSDHSQFAIPMPIYNPYILGMSMIAMANEMQIILPSKEISMFEGTELVKSEESDVALLGGLVEIGNIVFQHVRKNKERFTEHKDLLHSVLSEIIYYALQEWNFTSEICKLYKIGFELQIYIWAAHFNQIWAQTVLQNAEIE